MMTKTIIFDYDGTIHHTLGIYEPAFRETYQWLTEQKVTEEREIGSVEIAGWLGLNSKEMWNTFLPELQQRQQQTSQHQHYTNISDGANPKDWEKDQQKEYIKTEYLYSYTLTFLKISSQTHKKRNSTC